MTFRRNDTLARPRTLPLSQAEMSKVREGRKQEVAVDDIEADLTALAGCPEPALTTTNAMDLFGTVACRIPELL